MHIEKRLEELRSNVKSDRLSMSIGELAGLYERDELDIHPKFQRVLRWDREQKTRLIESILLRIPIPPIFVSQAQDGTWDVVDGAQRLGTLFEFLGVLKDDKDETRPALVLSKTNLLPELEGISFGVKNASTSKTFSSALRLDFRRSRLDLNIILKESTASSKYELFERLNTGGSIASPQEVRNCVMVWMNEKLFDWMQICLEDLNFKETTPLSERLEEQQYRSELLLRYLVLFDVDIEELRGIRDLGDFLNDKNRLLSTDLKGRKRADVEARFVKTFKLLNESLGSDVFRKWSTEKNRFSGPFLISAYESIAMGVAHNLNDWETEKSAATKIAKRIREMWDEANFTQHVGIGVASSTRMLQTIPFGRKHFKP